MRIDERPCRMTEALDEDGCLLVGRFFAVLLQSDVKARRVGKRVSVAIIMRWFIKAEHGRMINRRWATATDALVDEIRRLREQGLKYEEIGKLYGRSKSWANKIALINGIRSGRD